jgi:hypothetical protein
MTIHDLSPEEEEFLLALRQGRRVYFDWGFHRFWICINIDEREKRESWVSMDPDRVYARFGEWGVTSADAIILLGKIGVEITLICNCTSFKNDAERMKFWLYMKEFVPQMVLLFEENA